MTLNINPSTIVYTALFIDKPDELLKLFPPKHSKVFAHHSTIWFKPMSTEGLEIGKRTSLKIIGEAFDENGHAVIVENPKSKNPFPHITISCTEGVKPFYSEKLLEKATKEGMIKFLEQPVLIEVTEGYMDVNQNIIIG